MALIFREFENNYLKELKLSNGPCKLSKKYRRIKLCTVYCMNCGPKIDE